MRETYLHISQYRDRPKSISSCLMTGTNVPPYFAVPRFAKIGFVIFYSGKNRTAIFFSTEIRQNRYRHISILRETYLHIFLTKNGRNRHRRFSLLGEMYRHYSQYQEPPKSVTSYSINARNLPPYFIIGSKVTIYLKNPRFIKIGTGIFHYCGNLLKYFAVPRFAKIGSAIFYYCETRTATLCST